MEDKNLPEARQSLDAARATWDAEAASFDDAPDHGLQIPTVRAAWRNLMRSLLPTAPASIVDIGCGTGSLGLLMAELGHTVTGIDLSPAMIARARVKAAQAGQRIDFHIMDAAHPELPTQAFDVIVCRHLLWILPQPDAVIRRWNSLVRQGGRLVLIEGFWHTGAGLRASQTTALLPDTFVNVRVQPLHDQPALWHGPVTDERYAVTAEVHR